MAINRRVIALMIFMILLGLVFIQESFGFPNEPAGFRGNNWGTPVGEINCGLELITSIDKIKFESYMPDTKLKLFEAMLLFLDDKLVGYSMRLKDPSMVGMFLAVCCKLYGDPTSKSDKFVTWESKNTTVELDLVYGIITAGPMSGMRSLEALFDWYESQGGKISPKSKPHI